MKHILFSLCCIFLLASCSTQKNTLSTQNVDVPELQNLQKDEAMLQDTTMMPDDTNMMQKEDTMMEKSDSMQKDSMTSDDKMMKDSSMEKDASMMHTGVYSTYSPELVGKTKNTVLFFHAAWCPSCRAADSGILSGKIPDELTVLKVDYDDSDDLKRKYEILSQHTFVQVDAQGNMIKKWAGGTKIEDIVEAIN